MFNKFKHRKDGSLKTKLTSRLREKFNKQSKHSKVFMSMVAILAIALPASATARTLTESGRYKVLGQTDTKHVITTVKKFDDGTYAYCLEEAKDSKDGDYANVGVLNDENIYKTIKFGYPNQSWYSGPNAEKLNYYVTQVAVWSFTEGWDDAKINSFVDVDSGTVAPAIDTDINAMKQNIINLRHKVLNDNSNDIPSIDFAPHNITMSSKPGEGVQSEFITVTGNNLKGNAEISLSGAPAGTRILDESGNSVSSVPIGSKFKIDVPNSGKSGTFNFNIKGGGTSIRAVKYDLGGDTQDLAALDPVAITMPAVTAGTVNWNTPLAKSDIKLQKVSSEDNTPLAGATFALYKDGKELARGTSGSDGIITFANQPVGTYQVKEISAPTGYVVNPNMQNVTFEKGKVATVKMPNRPVHAEVKLRKIDADTKKPLVGAEFVLKQNGVEKYRGTTQRGGVLTLSNVKFGQYDVTEIKAPEGYNILKTPVKIDIKTDGQKIELPIENKIITGNVKLVKTDSETKSPIEGAEFGIYQGDKEISKATTNANGVVEFSNLKYGDYTVKEIKPAEGYLPNSQTWNVKIAEQGKTYNLDITNQPIKGKIQIVKIDANNEEKPVKDAKFHVFKANDLKTPIADLTTDENGFALTDNLRYGDYVLQEYDAPTSYYVNDKLYPVSIRENGKVMVQYVVNNPVEFRLKVIKTDNEKSVPLSGATFQIQKDGKPVVFEYQLGSKVVKEDKFVTDKDGLMLLPKEIGSGHYTLVELEAPQGYTKAEPIPFDIDRNTKFEKDDLGNIFTIKVTDELIRGHVKLVKTDYSNKPLKDVKFELYAKADKNPNTGKNDFFKAIDAVKETVSSALDSLTGNKETEKEQAPKGVDVKQTVADNSDAKKDETTDKDNTSNKDVAKAPEATDNKDVSKEDTKDSTKETSTKEDAKEETTNDNTTTKDSENKDNDKSNETKSNEVDKAIQDLKSNENLLKETPKAKEGEDQLIGLYKTNDKGEIVVKDLKYGEYYFKEVETPKDYILDQTPVNFTIKEKNKLVEVSMKNAKMGELELTKVDVSTGKVLADASFAIYSEDGKTVVAKGKTDSNGKAVFKLKPGKYFYQETQAPVGYKLDNKKFPFEIKPTGDIVKCRMTNVPIPVIPKTGNSITKVAVPVSLVVVAGGVYLFLRSRR